VPTFSAIVRRVQGCSGVLGTQSEIGAANVGF
jgi:hypothetical protein